jgi:hypothetical protein
VRYLPAWRGPGERDPRIRDLRNLRAIKEPAGNGHVAAVGV